MINDPSYIKKNLSIVIQGAVNRKNIIEVANYCKHWRDILPHAEIILSVSTTDFLLFKTKHENQPIIKEIMIEKENETIFRNCINSINLVCNKIIYNDKSVSTPLPPIKNDTQSLNNINHLIESSYNGICFVTKKYTLRIRNDSIFLDDSFIYLYCENHSLPRKSDTSIFKQRVMSPWIYTLNPFSEERLPLHVSDWLHFGLTEDIKKIWNIPYYTLQDAVFYKEKKNQDSNFHERKFNVRLAVEQYICLNTFQEKVPSLKIEYLNDLRSINISMDLILDNFYIFSQEEFSFRINKNYQKDLTNNYKRSSCITEDSWRFSILNRDIPFKSIFNGNVDDNILALSKREFIIKKFNNDYSPHHENNDFIRKIIFLFFIHILSNRIRSKFLFFPEKFYFDSKFYVVRKIGRFYLKN